MSPDRLHRRLAAGVAWAALIAFVSGAGFDAPMALPAGILLGVATFWRPAPQYGRWLEPLLRVLAILLAGRAGYLALTSPDDVVLPMVDLLLLLLVAEALRGDGRQGAARLYALAFALLVASAAYRPNIIFALAFVAFIVLMVVALMSGHVARTAERLHAREITLPRRFLFQTAALSSVVLLTSAFVFVTFPRVTRSWVARGAPVARAVVGFSDVVSLGEHGATLVGDPQVVLRVEFPDVVPDNVQGLHWRGRSYDHFDGVRWARTQLAAGAPQGGPRGVDTIAQTVYALSLEASVIFGLHPIVNVQQRSRIWPFRESNGDFSYYGVAAPVYTVTSAPRRPAASALRAAGAMTPAGLAPYLQLPVLSPRIAALADSIARGQPSRYDIAVAIETWLQTAFGYTLDLPATARQASLEYFLFNRREGHCEYFSTAMAVMLRTLGIPARNVNGFLGGTWNDFGAYLSVSQNNAHSWVEVWFPGHGWIQFDPTPAGAATSSTADTGRLGPLRAWLDGIEHQWGKWVLDYALEDQVDLFRRATAPFTEPTRGQTGGTGAWRRLAPWLLALLAIGAAVRMTVSMKGSNRRAVEVRAYRDLRTAYARAGYPLRSSTAPLGLLERLRRENAPCLADAQMIVDTYVRTRYGGEVSSRASQAAVRAALKRARAALGRHRRGAWLRRRPRVALAHTRSGER